jgi:hypothetical protein
MSPVQATAELETMTLSAPPIARLGRTMNSFLRPAFSGVFLVAVIDWQLGQEGIAQDEMG